MLRYQALEFPPHLPQGLEYQTLEVVHLPLQLTQPGPEVPCWGISVPSSLAVLHRNGQALRFQAGEFVSPPTWMASPGSVRPCGPKMGKLCPSSTIILTQALFPLPRWHTEVQPGSDVPGQESCFPSSLAGLPRAGHPRKAWSWKLHPLFHRMPPNGCLGPGMPSHEFSAPSSTAGLPRFSQSLECQAKEDIPSFQQLNSTGLASC